MDRLKEYFRNTDVATLALPSNIAYGTPIFTRGAVEILRRTDTEVEAWAGGLNGTLKEGAGSRRRVHMSVEGGQLRWHCTGNPKTHDIFCKHCVAVALFLKSQ